MTLLPDFTELQLTLTVVENVFKNKKNASPQKRFNKDHKYGQADEREKKAETGEKVPKDLKEKRWTTERLKKKQLLPPASRRKSRSFEGGQQFQSSSAGPSWPDQKTEGFPALLSVFLSLLLHMAM